MEGELDNDMVFFPQATTTPSTLNEALTLETPSISPDAFFSIQHSPLFLPEPWGH
jgi:hypothetical protein